MSDKIYLVTGATSGLGRATASRLAGMGAHVIMVCRDRVRGEAARDEIKSVSKNEAVELMTADLSSMASVRRMASEYRSSHARLDVLINDAAVVLSARTVTPEGLEVMFATNYLGPFLLARLLLPYLEAAKPSRIINISAPSTTRPNLEDLQGERKFSPLNAFGASKAEDLLMTYALARRLEGRGVTVNAYHPGIMKTSLNRTAPSTIRLVGGLLSLFAGAPPERASQGLVQLATSGVFAGTSGKLLHDGKMMAAPFIDDVDLQERLWKASCALAGVQEKI